MVSPAFAFAKKDVRMTRAFWAPMAFSYAVFLLVFSHNVWVYLAAAACLSFVAASTPLAIDDRYRTEPLFAALPAARRDLVAGRYAGWGFFTAAGLGLFLACTALIRAGLGDRVERLSALLGLRGIVAFLAGALLAALVFLPLHFRLGYWRAVWTLTIGGFLVSAAALNGIARLDPAAQARAAAMPRPFASTSAGLYALAGLIDRNFGRPAVAAGAAIVTALVGYISFRLSVRFYERRDL